MNKGALIFVIFIGALSFFTPNPGLTLGAIAIAVFLFKLLWRPGEPPILLYCLGFQWLQATILTFYADFQGLHLLDVDNSPAIVKGAWLTLWGLLALAIGVRLGAGANYGLVSRESVEATTSELSVRRLFLASLLAIALAYVLEMSAPFMGGLREPFLKLALLHWVVIYIFVYTVFSQRQGYGHLTLILGIELLIGLIGFFSDFKAILIVFFLAALAAPTALRGLRLRIALALIVFSLALGVVWTSIKIDYREFLNRGTEQQIVLVPVSDRLGKLVELTGELNWDKLSKSTKTLVNRITYIHYFSESTRMVPDSIPYEGGRLWLEAIQNFLVPRLLNPDKPIIDDSVRTAYYIGFEVYGVERGTSISLGYMAESYIDFGPIGMAAPIFLWGMFLGWTHRRLSRSSRFPLFGYACSAALLSFSASYLEQSNIKVLGGTILAFIVLYFVQKILSEKFYLLVAMPGKDLNSG